MHNPCLGANRFHGLQVRLYQGGEVRNDFFIRQDVVGESATHLARRERQDGYGRAYRPS